MVSGYPGCTVERTIVTDPYTADPDIVGFSMPQLWERVNNEFTLVAISVEAQWNPEDSTVIATSTVKWSAVPGDIDEANYRIEYVLVADGLSSQGSLWRQKNYYYNDEPGRMDYMDDFCQSGKYGSQYVDGLVFNDVAILTTGLRGVEGSIPSFEYGVATSHTHVFNTREALNFQGDPIPFHSDKLRVVAFVLKGYNYGTVLNACKGEVVPVPNGIASSLADKEVLSTRYYDLQGREVVNPVKGIYIKAERFTDGSVSNTKVIF